MELKDKIAVVSLWAPKVGETAHFYRDVLGLRLVAHASGGRPHFLVGNTLLVILEGEPQRALNSQPDRFPLLALETEGLDEVVIELEAQGVTLPWGVEEDVDSRWVMFEDLAGNLIEIAEFR
ncbi:MAG: VOC family protein [Chloroflexi bacterium]|nr:VOC family protein [Chloroflexota bacterium]